VIGPEKGAGSVSSDFSRVDQGSPDQLLGRGEPQQVTPREIVIECPVVIEFVGAESPAEALTTESVVECPVAIEFVGAQLAPEVRQEVVLAVMNQVASAVSHA